MQGYARQSARQNHRVEYAFALDLFPVSGTAGSTGINIIIRGANMILDGGVMTETKVEYKTGADIFNDITWLKCPGCGIEVGYEVEGGEYLKVGKLKVKWLRANCNMCDYEIYWSSSDRHLRKATIRDPLPTE